MNQMTTGASNDFERATEIARRMVTQWGMSDELGPMVYGENDSEIFLGRSITTHKNVSEATMQKVDAEIRRIIDQQYRLARGAAGGEPRQGGGDDQGAARVRDDRCRPDRRHHVGQAAAPAEAERLAGAAKPPASEAGAEGATAPQRERRTHLSPDAWSSRSSVRSSWAWSTSRPIPFPTVAASSAFGRRSRRRVASRTRARPSLTSAASQRGPGPSWFQRTKSCGASCPCSRSSTAFASRWTADGRKS